MTSDYKVLLEHRLDFLKQKNPQVLETFKDTPIVFTDKAMCNFLNYKMTTAYASKTKQELHMYHSHDKYRQSLIESMACNHTWQVSSTITKDHIGWLPLVPGMHVSMTENIAMTVKVVNSSQDILRNV